MKATDYRYWTGDGGNGMRLMPENEDEFANMMVIKNLIEQGGTVNKVKVQDDGIMCVEINWPAVPKK